MQVSVESLSALERRITVTVPEEVLEKAFDKRIASFAKQAKIDGFRPGKAPIHHIKQRYGTAAREEALGDVINSSLKDAILQEKINPAAPPSIEPKALVAGQPLEYVATFEVYPDLDQVVFDMTTMEKETATVIDADIDFALDEVRKQQATWLAVTRPAEDKDRVIIDFLGSIDGVPFQGGEAHDFPIILGSKRMIPGFEDGIVGISAGEEKTITVTFPEEYHSKDLAGKLAEFKIKAIKVEEPKLPELDADFLKKLGIKDGDIEELRKEIKINLDRELTRVIELKAKNQIFNHILERNPIDVPKSLIEREAHRLHEHIHQNRPHNHSEAEMNEFRVAARKNVALALLVGELVKKHTISTDANKVKERLMSIAASYENPEEIIRWYLSNEQAMSEINMQVAEDALVDKLLESVNVTEKVLSYRELTTGQPSAV